MLRPGWGQICISSLYRLLIGYCWPQLPSDWLTRPILTSLAAWMWSDLWIWSALSRLIRAYLSTPCPHCYHTLSLSPVSAASLIGAQETEALSLAFCHNSHYKLNRCPKFIEKIKVYRYVLRLDLPSYITTAWTRTFLSVIVILLLVTVSQEWL